MKQSKTVSQLFAAACCLLISVCIVDADEAATNEAEKLVQRALAAELDGNSDERDELLVAAIQADPSYAPARWHSGQILSGDENSEQKWLSIDDAEQKAAADPLLTKYVEMRSAAVDDAAGNESLAKWCQRNALVKRAEVHWARVLRHDPNHATAIRRLGLKQYQGRWFTRDQIAAIKEYKIRTNKLRKQWRPTMSAWLKTFRGNDSAAKDDVAREMKRVANAELVGLFESRLSPHDQQLALAVVKAIADVDEQVATESLVRHAVMSKWSSVRSAATDQLKDRSLHGFVPILIDAMMSPYEFQSWSVRSPLDDDQVLALNYSVGQQGKHADRLLNGTVNMLGARDEDHADDIREELQERIEELNEAAEKFNKPILQVLKSTTGQNLGDEPGDWNDWWNDYNEYYVPEYKPVLTSYQRTTSVVPLRPYSCFPAGTLVSTQTGRKPIEDIRIGDHVLSQNVATGELTYKPVLETSVRQSDAITEVVTNNERFLVTRGHPLWVNGRQWQMAKQLRRGDILHSADSAVKVEATRPVYRQTQVYNLVVADFHTYFVGDSRVMVHDNTIYAPPTVSVPGYKTD